jgi:wyosine [tRNA(Phe)-imidazoG37] synthetase (radical SAM superfamily)
MARRLARPSPEEATRVEIRRAPAYSIVPQETAFGYPRDFLENRFVYLVISPRAGGLSVGVNLNPIVKCTFQCLYCEVDRSLPARVSRFDVDRMAKELQKTLRLARSGALRQRERYARLPKELLQVRHVAISGDGEPTLSSHFVEALATIVHMRNRRAIPNLKLVIVTNSTALDQPRVQCGLRLLAPTDEVWAKLDGGTQEYLTKLNGATIPLEKILDNILLVAYERPVIIQSLFPAIDGKAPPAREIEQYILRLKELKEAGANIPLVQIYSAMRPMAQTGCSHLPLKTLCGIRAEVF